MLSKIAIKLLSYLGIYNLTPTQHYNSTEKWRVKTNGGRGNYKVAMTELIDEGY